MWTIYNVDNTSVMACILNLLIITTYYIIAHL